MTKEKHARHETKKTDYATVILVIAIVLFGSLFIYNSVKISKLTAAIKGGGTPTVLDSSVIPKGTPGVYGEELSVKYDDISANNPILADQTIRKLATFDQAITLTGNELERYIKIGSSISCEYCCGARAIIFSNGEAACGCAHSFAMRGLAKYLLQNHPTEFTDEQILEELGKWKVLFFPEIHMQKASVLKQNGIELNYINLASNKYRGIEKGATGGMVGGC